MFQYFVKIVPTTYVKLNEEVGIDEYVAQYANSTSVIIFS